MKSDTPHIVELSRLELGTYEFDYQLDNAYFAEIENSEILGGEVSAHATLTLREDDYDLSVRVSGSVQVACDRCLEPMDISVDTEEDMATLLDEEDEMESAGTHGKCLDIRWLAYELIIVNLPLVHCHPEGGCNPAMDALLQNHLCSTTEEPETI